MAERLGERRKGRRERMRKEPLFLKVLRVLQVQASKFGFFELIECIIKMSWCETECKKKNVPLVVNRM